MIVHCSSPTCTSSIHLVSFHEASYMEQLDEAGWDVVKLSGDSEPLPYCARCLE